MYEDLLNRSNDSQYLNVGHVQKAKENVKYYQKYMDNETKLIVYLPGKIIKKRNFLVEDLMLVIHQIL